MMSSIWGRAARTQLVLGKVIKWVLPRKAFLWFVYPDIILRYEPAIKAAKALDGGYFLDVGGGFMGLTGLVNGIRARGISIDPNLDSAKSAKRRNLFVVCGDGCNLPFGDDCFDLVSCIHTFEHVPDDRKFLLARELKRVAKQVVVEGPCGPNATRLSQLFIKALNRVGMMPPRFAFEHLEFGVPDKAFFVAAFPGATIIDRRNLWVDLVSLVVLHLPFFRVLALPLYLVFLQWLNKMPPFVEAIVLWKKNAGRTGIQGKEDGGGNGL